MQVMLSSPSADSDFVCASAGTAALLSPKVRSAPARGCTLEKQANAETAFTGIHLKDERVIVTDDGFQYRADKSREVPGEETCGPRCQKLQSLSISKDSCSVETQFE